MNPFTTDNSDNLKKTLEYCVKQYPGFDTSRSIIDTYCREADAFMSAYNSSQEKKDKTVNNNEHLPVSLYVDYIDKVFSNVFQKEKQAVKEVQQAAVKIEQMLCEIQKDDDCISVKTFVAKIKDAESLQTDFMTLIMTLTAAHLFRIYQQTVRQDPWERTHISGICIVCSTAPHYGMLSTKEGPRLLECWLCGNQWSFSRLECPYCHEKEQDKLGFFEVKELPNCRINFCRTCNQYIKIFDLREVNEFKPVLLPFHHATLIIDDLAVNEGFIPGSGLTWNAPIKKSTS